MLLAPVRPSVLCNTVAVHVHLRQERQVRCARCVVALGIRLRVHAIERERQRQRTAHVTVLVEQRVGEGVAQRRMRQRRFHTASRRMHRLEAAPQVRVRLALPAVGEDVS